MKNQKYRNYNETTLNPERGIGTENMKNYLKRGNGYVWNYFGTEYFLYVIAATGICGIVAKLIMDGFLKGLVRGAGSMKSTKKKALVEIRKRYEELSYLDVGIRDTRSFVEKYIYKLKLGKSYVSSWNSFCSNMMILAAGTGLVGTWWEYRTGSSVFASVQIGMWGIVACGVMQMVYNIFNTRRKCEMLSAELVSYMNNSLANRLKREQEKQMESSKQKADDRSRSGLKQTAAAIIEPNVIDIDAALAQMGEQKDRRNEKKAEAERRKSRETDIKKKDLQAVAETEPENKDGRLAGDGQKDAPEKNLGTSGMKMQEMDSTRERITAKSKKAMRAEHRRSEKSRRQSAAEGQQPLKQTAKEDDREITEEQIAACDALFDKLLQGISTT